MNNGSSHFYWVDCPSVGQRAVCRMAAQIISKALVLQAARLKSKQVTASDLQAHAWHAACQQRWASLCFMRVDGLKRQAQRARDCSLL